MLIVIIVIYPTSNVSNARSSLHCRFFGNQRSQSKRERLECFFESYNMIPLHDACKCNKFKVVKYLVENGSLLDVVNIDVSNIIFY